MTATFTITASAAAVPAKVLPNVQLTNWLETSDEWITQRTGIQQRHVATTETTTSLAVAVGRQLLANARLAARDVDLIVVATMSPDQLTPATATQVQAALGAENAVAFDINAACAGFVYGLQVVHQMLGVGQTALLIGSETLSRLVDWHDRRTAVLFGDGAGGVVVHRSKAGPGHWLGDHFATEGRLGHYLQAGQFPQVNPWQTASAESKWAFQMDGRRVYDFATKRVPDSIQRALTAAGVAPEQVQQYVLHQANARIIKSVARKLDLAASQCPINIAQYGNTAAASEPILFAELMAQGAIKRGDKVVFSGFGGGLSVGSVVIEF